LFCKFFNEHTSGGTPEMKLELATEVIGVASHALFGSWIAERYPTPESAKLQCAEATAAMVDAFPTLRRVRGHAMIGIDFRPHWWCIAQEGEIIDPTAHQWSTPPVFYDAIPEDVEEPCGKCICCGDLLYRSRGADSYLCENCKPNVDVELPPTGSPASSTTNPGG
jgi:hypothetical protein